MNETKRKKVFLKYDGHCAYCGQPLLAGSFTVDHVIPQSKGGTSKISNLLPCCYRCNQLKGAESIDILRIELFWKRIFPRLTLEKLRDFSNIRKEAAKHPLYFERPNLPQRERKHRGKNKKTPKGRKIVNSRDYNP